MSEAWLELRIDVLLSLQQALLGVVTADLRAVEVTLEDRRVTGRFVYDGAVTEQHRELVREVETLVVADLEDDVIVEFTPVTIRAPEPIPLVRGTTYGFLRREE